MFENYLIDADRELTEAVSSMDQGNMEAAIAKLRLCVLISICAMESYINFIVDTLKLSNVLTDEEIYYLGEFRVVLDKNKLKSVPDFKRLEDKIKVLIIKYDKNYNFGNSVHWSTFKKLKRLRDILTHPPENFEEPSVDDYLSIVNKGLSGIINIINYLNNAYFNRSIRRNLLLIDPGT